MWLQSSEHRRFSARAQAAEKVFRRYPTHVAGLVEVAGRGGGIALMLASVALDENAGDDKQEDSTESASKGNEYNEANGHVATYINISNGFDYICGSARSSPALPNLFAFSENKLDRLPGPLPEVESMKGENVVPLKSAADTLPKVGRFN